MELIEEMQSASLVALAVIAVVPVIARVASLKHFSYPSLIGFGVGYVAGAAAGAGLGATGIWEEIAKLVAAFAAMYVVRSVARKHVAAA